MIRYVFIIFLACTACLNALASRESDENVAKKTMLENYRIGLKFDNEGDYNRALDYLLLFIKDAESAEGQLLFAETHELSYAYLIVGNIHLAFFDYGASLKYYKIGYEKSLKINKPLLQSSFLNNMTVVCCFLNRFKEAELYNETMIKIKGINIGKQKHSYVLNKGFIALRQGDWRKAIDYMLASVRYVDEYKLKEKLKSSPYSEIYPIYEEQGQLDSALYYLKKYNEIAVRDTIPNMIVDSYKGLMRMYTKIGDKEKALKYQEIYVHLADSLLNTNEFMRIKNDYVEFEDVKTGKKIENLQGTVSKQKVVIIISVAVILLIAAAVIAIYLQKRVLRKAYMQLFERNKELVEMEQRYRKEIQEIKNSSVKEMEQQEVKGDVADEKSIAELPGETDSDLVKELVGKITAVVEGSDIWCNSDFTLVELSKMVGSNTKYVSQVINEIFGKNFRSFINEYRIKEARKRMTDVETYGNYTIQGIAESVGFKSATNFNIAFKKITGITPSLYQKMAKQENAE